LKHLILGLLVLTILVSGQPAKSDELTKLVLSKGANDDISKLVFSGSNPHSFVVGDSLDTLRKEAAEKAESDKQSQIEASRRLRSQSTNQSAVGGTYPYGYCTYWASQEKGIPGGFGNAKNWLVSAKNYGYQTGQTPEEGAVVVTSESSLGHVAYVEEVTDTTIEVSEMNYIGRGVVSRRVIPRDYRAIRGYIY